jgi:RNA 3'-phosphate cyclase
MPSPLHDLDAIFFDRRKNRNERRDMIIIDGSEGEGGGQVVRNACALSLITGQAFRIFNVRGGREKPGLMRQHVTAIEAACALGNAECEGLAVGASEVTFRPGRVVPGDYHFSVGTAGSTGLVLQTILMPLILADGPSRVVLEGGTHNMMAPPFDFIARSFLPVLERMGPRVSARLVRHGFYPRGGGRIEVDIVPASLVPIECLTRGALVHRSATAIFAALPFEIAQREIATARGPYLADQLCSRACGWRRFTTVKPSPVESSIGSSVVGARSSRVRDASDDGAVPYRHAELVSASMLPFMRVLRDLRGIVISRFHRRRAR